VSPEHPPLVIKTSDDIVRSSWKHETNEDKPYPYVNVPDGIAFSCSLKGTPEASLSFMFKEINDTVYNDPTRVHNADLARWSNQGILMLNVALTTTFNKVGEHYELWKPFINFLLDMIFLQQ
jgi:uracil DNA glycosylase